MCLRGEPPPKGPAEKVLQATESAPAGAPKGVEAETETPLLSHPLPEGREVEAFAKGLVAHLIVALSGLGVDEHMIGLRDLLKPLLGFIVSGVDVRVVLAGELAVCFLYLIWGGGLLKPQGLVVVFSLMHCRSPPRGFLFMICPRLQTRHPQHPRRAAFALRRQGGGVARPRFAQPRRPGTYARPACGRPA